MNKKFMLILLICVFFFNYHLLAGSGSLPDGNRSSCVNHLTAPPDNPCGDGSASGAGGGSGSGNFSGALGAAGDYNFGINPPLKPDKIKSSEGAHSILKEPHAFSQLTNALVVGTVEAGKVSIVL